MSTQLSLMNLYDIGAHRGNHKSRLNSRLKNFIYGKDKNSLCIIDLAKTLNSIDQVSELMKKLGSKRRQVFIVGTSKYISEYVPELAASFNGGTMPYVDNRWLGGNLTNWLTIKKTLKHIEKLENILNNAEFFNKLSRNEQLSVEREYNKKIALFRGLKNLKSNKPGAILILDTAKNATAIEEAQAIGIPVIAFTNLNSVLLPSDLSNTLVFNNTSLNAVKTVASKLVEAYNDGLATAAEIPATPIREVSADRSDSSRDMRSDRDRRPRFNTDSSRGGQRLERRNTRERVAS